MQDEHLSLTPKQEAFAQAYVETGNASKAYRRAYDAENMKPTSIMVNACRLLQQPKVALRVAGLREDALERHEMTVDTLTALLMDDRDFAKENGAPAAATSATLGLMKLHGLGGENVNLSNPDGSLAREPRYNLVDKGGPKP